MNKNSNLSRNVEKFIYKFETLYSKPLYELTPNEARNFLDDLQNQTSIAANSKIRDRMTDTGYGQINVRIVSPQNIHEKLPAILYLHGGGWILGNKTTHNYMIRILSEYSKSIVIFPEYSLSPEAAYPVAINQIYSLLKLIYNNSEEFNIDKNRIAIAGDSAGGNMAAVITIMNKREDNIPLKYQALFYPVASSDMNTKSYKDFHNGPWLSKKAMEWFWDAYAPDKQIRSSIYISPLNSSIDELQGLPDTLIITAENDVLRDEGEEYARKLDRAGINVTSVRIGGTIHDFLMLNALKNTNETKDTLYMAGKLIERALYS